MDGGYIFVNSSELDFTKVNEFQTKADLFNDLKKAIETGKPIILSNSIMGSGKYLSPINCFAYQYNDNLISVFTSVFRIDVSTDTSENVGISYITD